MDFANARPDYWGHIGNKKFVWTDIYFRVVKRYLSNGQTGCQIQFATIDREINTIKFLHTKHNRKFEEVDVGEAVTQIMDKPVTVYGIERLDEFTNDKKLLKLVKRLNSKHYLSEKQLASFHCVWNTYTFEKFKLNNEDEELSK